MFKAQCYAGCGKAEQGAGNGAGFRLFANMPSMLAYLAPLALLVPSVANGSAPACALEVVPQVSPEASQLSEVRSGFRQPQWVLPPLISHQVRIERRVTVRISPRSAIERQSLMAESSELSQPTRYQERKIGKCLSVADIAGVQTGSGDRLLLFMRDRRMITARLEKSCRARDFYSGFYLERNEDGRLCVERDKLQSRAGANCQISRIRELIPVED